MSKHIGVVLLLLLGGLWAEPINPVRVLKATDGNAVPIYSGEWQNRSATVIFTWKDPYADKGIKGYRYSFGTTKASPDTEITDTRLEKKLTKDGVYYFSVVAVDVSDTVSEPKTFEIWYSAKQPENTLTVAAIDSTQPELVFDKITTAIPFKGIVYAVGTGPQIEPDLFASGNVRINKYVANTTNYVVAAIEDVAGNVSAPKVVGTFLPKQSLSTEPPKIKILSRETQVNNPDPKDTDVKPGSHIAYTIAVKNEGAGSGFDIDLKDSVPDGTTIVPALGNVSVPAVTLYFDQTLNAGKGAWTENPENPRNVTQVRWILKNALGAGQEFQVSYSVIADRV